MNVYPIETRPEDRDGMRFVSVRCPHIDRYGYVCGRQLLRLVCDGNATIELKCHKCKSVIRVEVVGQEGP